MNNGYKTPFTRTQPSGDPDSSSGWRVLFGWHTALPTLLFALLLLLALNAKKDPDLLVYGGTPQGVTAAIAAARQGLKVTLIEPSSQLGGVVVRGWLATLDDTDDAEHRSLYGGLYADFYRATGSNRNVDVWRTEQVLGRMLRRAGVDVRMNTDLATGAKVLDVRGDELHSVWVSKAFGTLRLGSRQLGLKHLNAKQFIDATDTADLAARAGAAFTTGREDGGLDRRQMAATLVFRLGGVHWPKVKQALQKAYQQRRDIIGYDERGAYGFGDLVRGYVADQAPLRLRGLNIARQNDQSLLVNALLIAGVDGTDPQSTHQAYLSAAAEAQKVVAYLRRADPLTFGRVRLMGVAPALYIRESRHLVGLRRLHADDVLLGRADEESVATGGYPLDGQIYDARESPFLLGQPAPYGVPYGALVPRGFSNLLVVSQAASFDSAAAFSARVVPLQMVLGEAAGTACSVARARRLSLAQLADQPQILRPALIALGIRIPAATPAPLSGAVPVVSATKLPNLRYTSVHTEPRHTAPRTVFSTSSTSAERTYYASLLLRRGLLSAPYNLRGDLGADQPILAIDFLASLDHWLVARSAVPGHLETMRREAMHDLKTWARKDPNQPLSWAGGRAIFLWLGEDAWEFENKSKLLSRGDAARLLTDMFPARDRHFSDLPFPEPQECGPHCTQ
jgi:FAD dependent oxidoreductase